MQLPMQLKHHQPNTLSIFAEVVLVHILASLRSALSSNHLCSACPDAYVICHAVFQCKTVGYAHPPNLSKLLALSSQFCGVLIFDLKRIAGKLEAAACRPARSSARDIQTQTGTIRVLLAFTFTKGHSRGAKAWQKHHTKSLV